MATSAEVVKATLAHAEALAPRMRREDALEVGAASGREPMDALILGLDASLAAYTILLGGEVAAMFGVTPVEAPREDGSHAVGCAWMLTSDAVDAHPVLFARLTKAILPELLDVAPVLFNAVDARYAKALRWAAFVGFAVEPTPVPFGVEGLPFHLITATRSSVRSGAETKHV